MDVIVTTATTATAGSSNNKSNNNSSSVLHASDKVYSMALLGVGREDDDNNNNNNNTNNNNNNSNSNSDNSSSINESYLLREQFVATAKEAQGQAKALISGIAELAVSDNVIIMYVYMVL